MFLTENKTVEYLKEKILARNNRIFPEVPLFWKRQAPPTNQSEEAVENIEDETAENENAVVENNANMLSDVTCEDL